MANLHNEFKKFHDRIVLTPPQKESLKKSRDAVRDRIRKYFSESLQCKVPKFHGQGSYAMKTIINPLDGEFDIDDGVYLQHLNEKDSSEWPAPETVHKWIVNATKNHTNEKPIDKRTCVRVRYAGQYHIDLPIYARLNGEYMLAEKGEKRWHPSDPKALTDWFNEQVKKHGDQLRRMVRCFKAWADFQSGRKGKMPSGLILTVLATQNFCAHERDDIAFTNTAKAISKVIKPVFCVYNPVDRTEELTERLTETQKSRFQEAISDLVSDAIHAIETKDPQESSRLWRKQFGDRFPAVENADYKPEQMKKDATKLAAFYSSKKPVKPWGYY